MILSSRIKLCWKVVAILATLSPAGAFATEYCDIKKTTDGFVALRAEPGSHGKLVARMKSGDDVMFDSTVGAKGNWAKVFWWKGGRFRGQSFRGLVGADARGWVNAKLIDEVCG